MDTIFGINGKNSPYSSILSKSKALKESKENSKISFANTLIKENITKLNDIKTENTLALAKSEALNFNPMDTLQNSIYALKYKQNESNSKISSAVSTAYGYGVDKEGYMTEDFNQAAGLPKDFKIHKSTLEEIERVSQENVWASLGSEYLGIERYFDNIDMADTLKQYYNRFNQIVEHTFNDPNKTSFSDKDLALLPKGYSVTQDKLNLVHKNMDHQKIIAYYSTEEQFNEMKNLCSNNGIDMGSRRTNFTPESMQTQNYSNQDLETRGKFNPSMSFYPKNEDGTYTKEALFMSFIKSSGEGGVALEGGNTRLNPKAAAFEEFVARESFSDSSVHLYEILTAKIDFASLLKAYAQEGWFDEHIYAKENGVKWQNGIIGYGGAWFDRQFEEARAKGWKPSNQDKDSYVNSITERLQNLISQTRAV